MVSFSSSAARHGDAAHVEQKIVERFTLDSSLTIKLGVDRKNHCAYPCFHNQWEIDDPQLMMAILRVVIGVEILSLDDLSGMPR